jgi:hypothetical protein
MSYQISSHAQTELQRRAISRALLEEVLATPEQKVPEHGGIVCYQSQVMINSKRYLLRVMVDESQQPPRVVTVYRTSKITKYWSQQ